jgi:hypothetical protein
VPPGPWTTKKPLPLIARSLPEVVNFRSPCWLIELRIEVVTPPEA